MQNIVGQAFKDHNAIAKKDYEKIPIIALANWSSIQNNANLINRHVNIVFMLMIYEAR